MSKIKDNFVREGINKGIQIGIEQGIDIRNEQIVTSMIKNGDSDEKIVLYTGIPIDQIAVMRQQIKSKKSRLFLTDLYYGFFGHLCDIIYGY
ncbi:MAG TPA: hypothetical protein VHP36_06010 [Chitinispirillaceae bacterium]|nr:hypothetical protein [Chitinispirillaceae bacterium]